MSNQELTTGAERTEKEEKDQNILKDPKVSCFMQFSYDTVIESLDQVKVSDIKSGSDESSTSDVILYTGLVMVSIGMIFVFIGLGEQVRILLRFELCHSFCSKVTGHFSFKWLDPHWYCLGLSSFSWGTCTLIFWT